MKAAIGKRKAPASRSRRKIRMGRYREFKVGAAGKIRACPQSSAARFDDRAADRKPQPQTAWLGRVKGLEEAIEIRWSQPWAGISHGDEHAARLGWPCTDHQFPGPVADAAHCLDGVHDQVQDHLLQFDPVSLNR